MELNCNDINELIKNYLFSEHERNSMQQEIEKLNTIINCKDEEIKTLKDVLGGLYVKREFDSKSDKC